MFIFLSLKDFAQNEQNFFNEIMNNFTSEERDLFNELNQLSNSLKNNK